MGGFGVGDIFARGAESSSNGDNINPDAEKIVDCVDYRFANSVEDLRKYMPELPKSGRQ
jgi:hypothetical protein